MEQQPLSLRSEDSPLTQHSYTQSADRPVEVSESCHFRRCAGLFPQTDDQSTQARQFHVIEHAYTAICLNRCAEIGIHRKSIDQVSPGPFRDRLRLFHLEIIADEEDRDQIPAGPPNISSRSPRSSRAALISCSFFQSKPDSPQSQKPCSDSSLTASSFTLIISSATSVASAEFMGSGCWSLSSDIQNSLSGWSDFHARSDGLVDPSATGWQIQILKTSSHRPVFLDSTTSCIDKALK